MTTLVAHAAPGVGDLTSPDLDPVTWLESLSPDHREGRFRPTYRGGLYQVRDIESDTGDPFDWNPRERIAEYEYVDERGARGFERVVTTFDLPPGIR